MSGGKRKYKKIPLTLGIVLVVLLAVLAIQVVRVGGELRRARADAAALEEQRQDLAQENEELRQDLARKDDESFIKALARELLGLAEEGERIFYDVNE